MTLPTTNQKNNAGVIDDLDMGSGAFGPWLTWQARASLDGNIPGRSFVVRDGDTKTVTDAFEKGVVMDFRNVKLGWCMASGAPGTPPTWQWSEDPRKLGSSPGEDYKPGFSIPCLLPDGRVVTWEQNQTAAFTAIKAFKGIVSAGSMANPDKLPKVVMSGIEDRKYRGGSTSAPVLAISEWVDIPPELDDESDLPFEVEVVGNLADDFPDNL